MVVEHVLVCGRETRAADPDEELNSMKRQAIAFALASGLFVSGHSVFADGDPAAGRLKADTCMGCHGVSGYFNVYPSYRVPKLGGQSAAYIESALKAYRAGARKHDTMHANATGLSDQDMADVAAFIASIGR